MKMQFNEEFLKDPNAEGSQFGTIPAGTYNVEITKAEVKKNSKGTGSFVALEMTVNSEKHKGRKLFDTINYKHTNDTTQDIGRRTLIDIRNSVGLKELIDSDQLVGGQLTVKVTVTEDEKYGEKNRVTQYKPLDGSRMPSVGSGSTGFGKPSTPKEGTAQAPVQGSKMPPVQPKPEEKAPNKAPWL